jgi:hypothetical protein
MLWFLKYFRRKIQRKMAFLTQNKAKLCKICIITLVFEKNANFFAENCQKSQKIVIITSVPGWPDWANLSYDASVVKIYSATNSMARFKNKNNFSPKWKRSSLLQRWLCSCKFKSRRIGSRVRICTIGRLFALSSFWKITKLSHLWAPLVYSYG